MLNIMGLKSRDMISIPLGIPDVHVLSVELNEQGDYIVTVESTQVGTICQHCGRKITKPSGHGRWIELRHLPILGHRVYIRLRPKRYEFPHCDNKSTTQTLDWYETKSPHTKAYDRYLMLQLVNSTDKFNIILRIEPTVLDVSFFKQYRQVQHRDGTTTTQWAPMKKTILPALQEVLLAANQRYVKFISVVETPEVGVQKLYRLAATKGENDHRYKGFNLLSEEDASLFQLLARGEFTISGFTNKSLRQHLPHKNLGQVSRLLKRLRVHGLIKKVGRRYKYYLTEFGREVIMMALKLREIVIIPELAYGQAQV